MSWHSVTWTIELSTGFLASGTLEGGEWDVDLWDGSTALWGSTVRSWTDVSDDWISLKTKRGRERWGDHYRTATATVVLDDTAGAYHPESLAATAVELGQLVRITATLGSTDYPIFTGAIRNVAISDTPGKARAVTLSLVGPFAVFSALNRTAQASQGSGDGPGARIRRILDDIGWPEDDRQIANGVEALQATTLAGSPITELYLVSDSEGGEIYGDANGRVVFLSRSDVDALSSGSPAFTVAGYPDPGGAGVWIPWSDYATSYSLDDIVNVAKIGRTGGSLQTSEDAESKEAHGPRSQTITNLLNTSDTWPALLADRIVAARKDAKERIVSVELTDAPDDTAIGLLLDVELGDPIDTSRTLGAGVLDQTALVQGISYDATPAMWRVTLATDLVA